ncbi:MAG: type IV toxin-antitoxin system AbiEi family antitoxin [Anaerolineae bacterium]
MLETNDGQRQAIALEMKSTGEPRCVRAAAAQAYRYRQSCPELYWMLAAPYVSDAAAAVCREEGIGYVDLAGNTLLSVGSIHIERTGRPNVSPERRQLRSLYSPRTERILRSLLLEPKRAWTLSALAAQAGVSLGLVHKVKESLLDREWLRNADGGLRLAEPGALLVDWGAHYHRRGVEHRLYTALPLAQAEAELAASCRQTGSEYALTGLSAAARLAPFVRYLQAEAYLVGDVEPVAEALGAHAVDSGANLVLVQPQDEGVLMGAVCVDGVAVVSPVQAYLDLQMKGGRRQEAAGFLLKQEVEPTWQ